MTKQLHLRSPFLACLLSSAAALTFAPLDAQAITAADVLPGADPTTESPAAPSVPLSPQPSVPAGLALMAPLRPASSSVFALTPERRALLNTIRFAEGTWAEGQALGYRIMFGGGLMSSLDRHPDRVVRSARYASAAAGAYQFMPSTWSLVSRALGLEGFGPEAQDQGALLLVQRRGALSLIDQGQFTPQLAARLAPEWASFPTLAGASYYGQPVKRFEHLRRFFEQNLAQLRSLEFSGSQPTDLASGSEPRPPLTAASSVGSLVVSSKPAPSVVVQTVPVETIADQPTVASQLTDTAQPTVLKDVIEQESTSPTVSDQQGNALDAAIATPAVQLRFP